MSDISNITSKDILDLFQPGGQTSLDALAQMRESFADRVSDSDMARFLIARKFNVEDASKMLTSHLEWREANPLVFKADCMTSLSLKNAYCHGVDREGHPLMFFHTSMHNPKTRDIDETNRMFQWWFHQALASMPDDRSKITLMIDRTGAGMANQDIEFLKSLHSIWQDNFPERIYRIIVCPTGMIFYGLWNIIQYFLDPVTKDKVKPCYNNAAVTEFIDPVYLPECLGGTCTYTVPEFEDLVDTPDMPSGDDVSAKEESTA